MDGLFPSISLRHLPHSYSDHCPLLLQLKQELGRKVRHFRFETWWTLEDSFEAEVRQLWGSSVGPIDSKLNALQLGLCCWEKRIKQANRGIKEMLTKKLKALMVADRNKENFSDLIETKLHLKMEVDKDELYWEQRARINWLRGGDKNTSFFHKQASQRRRVNTMNFLEYGDGRSTRDIDEMVDIAKGFFKKLFTSKHNNNGMAHILSSVDCCVAEPSNVELCKPFIEDEV